MLDRAGKPDAGEDHAIRKCEEVKDREMPLSQ